MVLGSISVWTTWRLLGRLAVERFIGHDIGQIALACIVGRYHYVVDVIAGILIAAACWVAVIRLFAANADATPKQLASRPKPPRRRPSRP